jgi:hypothetical protein
MSTRLDVRLSPLFLLFAFIQLDTINVRITTTKLLIGIL